MKEKEKKIPLPADVHAELEKKAEAEGTTPDELAEKVIVEKTKGERKAKKSDKPVEEKKAAFPVEGMVNAYGFLHLSNGTAEAFGAPRGKKTQVKIDFKDGNLIISKT